MTKHDELIFFVRPRVDTTSHGIMAYRVDLTAIRDGHPGRSDIPKYAGSKGFGLQFALAIKARLIDRRLSESDAMQHKSAANRFMEFFDRNEFDDETEPSRRLLIQFADDIEHMYGDEIPTDMPRIYRTIVAIFKKMCPGLIAPRKRFVCVDTSGTSDAPLVPSINEERRGAANFCAASVAMADFRRVRDRISLGRLEAISEGEDLLQTIHRSPNAGLAKVGTQEGGLRLLYRHLDFKPITADEFHRRFGVRADECLRFPAPGRAATAGASVMQTGLVGAFRWVVPTATDLMGPVVLCLENTGWNRSTILAMKSSMVTEALESARNGRSRIFSWKGRAHRPEETSLPTGAGSLLDVLSVVQEWTTPLRDSIEEQLASTIDILKEELSDERRHLLERKRDGLSNMKDRLWLCLGSCPVGVTRLKENDLSAKCFRAMFTDNGADLNAIGKYNCHEARLNYLARVERGSDVQLELLRAISRHRSVSTTLRNYASKLPGSVIRDRTLAQFSRSVTDRASPNGIQV